MARFLAMALAMHLLSGLGPSHVLCVHHDGQVSIERAAAAPIRCDDAARRCAAGGTLRASDEHCHDAAIAQPGIGQRPAPSGLTGYPAVPVGGAIPELRVATTAGARRAHLREPGTAWRHTVVLRV